MTHNQLQELVAAYTLGVLDPEEQRVFDAHLALCPECRAEARSFSPVIEALATVTDARRTDETPLGILPDAQVRPGDHIAYFWETDAQFRRGVGFLSAERAAREHWVVFGHEQANGRVLATLARQEIDLTEQRRCGRLTVLGCESTGDATLQRLGATFRSALDSGAPLIRLLGNIGWGHSGWPADGDLIGFEHRVTSAIRDLPAAVVCMYDVQALPGRVVMDAGLAAHPVTIVRDVVRPNAYYAPAP